MANPIVEVYKGIPIHQYNTLVIRIDVITLKKIIDLEQSTNLSQRQILSHSSKPCSCCKDSFVTVETSNGTVMIPRGLMSRKIPVEGSGTSKKRKIHG